MEFLSVLIEELRRARSGAGELNYPFPPIHSATMGFFLSWLLKLIYLISCFNISFNILYSYPVLCCVLDRLGFDGRRDVGPLIYFQSYLAGSHSAVRGASPAPIHSWVASM